MTTDISRFVFYLGLSIVLLTRYGECKGELLDSNQHHNADDSKLTKPIAEDSTKNADSRKSQPSSADDSRHDSQVPIKILPDGFGPSEKLNTSSTFVSVAKAEDDNGSIQKSVVYGDEPSTSQADIFISTKASKFTVADRRSDERGIDDVKKKLSDLKQKVKKDRESESVRVPASVPVEDADQAKSPDEATEDEETEPVTKLEKPVIVSSRGKLRFQFDNSITESIKATGSAAENGLENGVRIADDISKLPLVKSSNDTTASISSDSVQTSSSSSTTDSDKGKNNATRSAKSSFHYQGGDGYTFENQFAIDSDRDDASKFDDRVSTYPINDPGNNIDRVRNFNENSNNVKLKNIVRKPQGFVLTTESSAEAELLRKTVTRFGAATTGKRRSTESPAFAAKLETTTTEASSTAVGKNEIARKPSMKPSSSYSSRRRVQPTTTALNENYSLPTTSTAWALASLKTPASVKTQKRPSGVEVLKKNVVEMVPASPKPVFMTTIKPFKSWSVKLQKTTTESATDIPTTMKPLMEVDAETLSPIALSGPVLMNMSEISVPSSSSSSSTTTPKFDLTSSVISSKRNEGLRNETTDIHFDLMEDSHKPLPVLDVNSSHKIKDVVADTMRYNYMAANSSNEKNNTFISLNVHKAENEAASNNPANILDFDNNAKNEIQHVSKPTLVKLDLPLNDEAPRIETFSSTTENSLFNANHRHVPQDLLNDVKSPSEVNDLRNTSTDGPAASSSEILRGVDYQNTESNTIFDQIFKVKKEKNDVPTKQADHESSNGTESELNKGDSMEIVTKHFDPEIEPIKRENSTVFGTSSSDSTFDNIKEVVTDPSPIYDIEIDDDNTPTIVVNQTVAVDNKDNRTWTSNVATSTFTSTTTSTTTTTPRTIPTTTTEYRVEISSTVPTIKLTTKTESVDDIMTTTRRTAPKRIFTTPSIMTARPSTTTQMITTTSYSFDDFTTLNPLFFSSTTKRKNTKLSPASPRIPVRTTTEEVTTMASTSSTVRTTEETRSKFSKSTTEMMEPVITISTSSPKPAIILPSSTEQIEVHTLDFNHPSVVSDSTSTEKSPSEITIVETTFSPSNELPTVPTFQPKLPPESVPAYLMLIFKSSFAHICRTKAALKENLFQYITERSSRVQSKDQVVMVVDPEQCKEPDDSPRLIPVALYVVDDLGSYDKTLIDEMQAVLDVDNLNNYTIPIHKIVYQPNFVPDNSRVIAAMIITSIAAVCFVLLIFLMCTIRNRQKLSYGQRCTPVSVDDYNLDNISEFNNSIRRKGAMRASKRSYGNPAFDDPLGPSKTLTYNGLIKACENRMALDDEFSQIPVITVKPEELPPGAEVKNRYANIIPLPETRVSLSNHCSDSIHDYINANYVKGFKGADKFYIACQAPLQNTIEDFWKMIWKEQAKVIIMLTALSENGVEKCADYLPPSEVLDCHRLFGDYQVTLKKREVKEKYVISSLQLKNMENNLWREVTHLWYTSWPTQGVPNEQSSIIALLIEARAYMRNSPGPHVVHCSPGTGRTGTVIACDICIRDYELTRSVNIPLTVAKLRRCRAGAVQTKEQYAFIYKVLTLYARKLNGGTPLESL